MKKNIIILIVFLLIILVGKNAFSEEKWREYKQNHFIIYYKSATFDFVQNVATSAEEYYAQIALNLGFIRNKSWTSDNRAKIYIYDDIDDYRNSGAAQWSHGIASPEKKIIRTFPAAHGFFDSTLPHELGHIVFREFVGFDVQVPLWFEEGVAMYQEKARRWGSHEIVRESIRNKEFIPLQELTNVILRNGTSTEKVDLFYAESASSVYYLISELGQNRFVRFCRKLEQGTRFDWALESVYVRFKTEEDLNKAWVDYLMK